MSLESLIKEIKHLLGECTADVEKAENGNKAAAQRVRTGTVKLEKVAKKFRKESIVSEKKGLFDKAKKAAQKKKAEAKKKASPKKAEAAVKAVKTKAKAKKVAAPAPKKKAAPKKAQARVRTVAHKKVSRPSSLSQKRVAPKSRFKRAGA